MGRRRGNQWPGDAVGDLGGMQGRRSWNSVQSQHVGRIINKTYTPVGV